MGELGGAAPTQRTDQRNALQLVLAGVVTALLVLLLAAMVRNPAHPPFYDTISSSSEAPAVEP